MWSKQKKKTRSNNNNNLSPCEQNTHYIYVNCILYYSIYEQKIKFQMQEVNSACVCQLSKYVKDAVSESKIGKEFFLLFIFQPNSEEMENCIEKLLVSWFKIIFKDNNNKKCFFHSMQQQTQNGVKKFHFFVDYFFYFLLCIFIFFLVFSTLSYIITFFCR